MTQPSLSKDVIRATYNRFGKSLDRRQIFARPAQDYLLKTGQFEKARHVLEIGCGTGQYALRLLKEKLTEQCLYTGIDLSEVMIELTRKKLKAFGPRIRLIEADATEAFHIDRIKPDRIVISYILDLMTEEEGQKLLKQAYDHLENNGLLCLITLIPGEAGLPGVLSRLWSGLYKISPRFFGGCKPLYRAPLLQGHEWTIELQRTVSGFGVTSEVMIVRKREPAQIEQVI